MVASSTPRASTSCSSSSSPCAACKFLRRKCTAECVFAPHFPPDEPVRFANVHKIFGASNVAKILNDLPESSRQDAVKSLAYEAEARVNDPVYGCVSQISEIQQTIHQTRNEIDILKAQIQRIEEKGIRVPTIVSEGLPPSSRDLVHQGSLTREARAQVGYGIPLLA